ncbi:glycine--tRNA ligase subunit beta [Brochothrix campestris]|uniref:Glycine--tRNA ligase beta subunit n=1 Tax=Brochothrix campestris FSL F6-1037 TaxID=1265861 RepID=W7CQY6_9LIST|nr:glycine--tRNA ligase subunit beta [Brochothrix campestris]EUJ42059.1 glycyl-tRNA ligase subunit beta [Brochothrix campestris FSL F6-1037]
MTQDILLEIGLEEMPAKYVQASEIQLKEHVEAWLAEKGLAYEAVASFSTPRRLAVTVKAVAPSQADSEDEVRGPARKTAQDENGDWSRAAQGFVRGQGLTTDDIFFKELKGTEYAFVNKKTVGVATADLLKEWDKIILGLNFPVNMHWANHHTKYIRPIHWIVALYGDTVIPFSILDVTTGRTTRGHRFLGHEIDITSAATYETQLKEVFVIAQQAERRQLIADQIADLASVKNWNVPIDADLLEEVTNLVEYPTVLFGNYEENYLDLPADVLITIMREHQRYFPVMAHDGQLLPFFITVRNGNAEHLETVAKGNEKVLRARLSDGEFFYQEDQKITIAAALEKLKKITFHQKIGTMSDKIERVGLVATKLAGLFNFSASEIADVQRAAAIYKFDLVTNLVGEFPELQGEMGAKYALLQGENEVVATAIRESYMPTSSEGELPATKVGALLALADKLETLGAFFSVDMIPTGSNDPFALRRAMIGVVRILIDQRWELPFDGTVRDIITLEEAAGVKVMPIDETVLKFNQFLARRLRNLLANDDVRHDLIEAAVAGETNDLAQLFERAAALNKVSQADWFRPTVEALTRVMNLARKLDKTVTIDETLFENESEQALYREIKTVKAAFAAASSTEKLTVLKQLQQPIARFFENTLVMVDDEAIRTNRLAMLAELNNIVARFAKFDAIIVK